MPQEVEGTRDVLCDGKCFWCRLVPSSQVVERQEEEEAA